MRVPHPRCARNGRPEPPHRQACTKCRCPATSARPDRRARLPHDSGAIGHCAAPRSAENEGPVKREALELDTSTPYVERAIRPPTRRNSLQSIPKWRVSDRTGISGRTEPRMGTGSSSRSVATTDSRGARTGAMQRHCEPTTITGPHAARQEDGFGSFAAK
jgi:hypothetical protein